MPEPIQNPAALPGTGGNGRIAVIDIGSNSMRLVVYAGLCRSPVPLFNEKIMCGLGRTVERTGMLNPEGVQLALDNLTRFRFLIEAMDVERVDVLATAAVRDASDGPAFVREIKRLAGFDVRTIAGEEEARLSALGVLSGTPDANGVMGDLGGGSLELVGLQDGVIGDTQVTLPLGPLRLSEAAGGRAQAALRIVDEHLERQGWLGAWRGRTFYPVGGSWRALAKLHMEQTNHPVHIIHHYEVDTGALRDFLSLIVKQSRSSLEKAKVSRRRLETLPFAALVLERALRAAAPSRVVFSAHGLREGLLYEWLTPEERRHDPLLSACRDVAERYGRFSVGTALSHWTDALFPGEDTASARLRYAACLLSDLGWAEHPDYRAEHTFLRVLRMPVSGIDHAERVFLAMTSYVRYAGALDDAVVGRVRGLAGDAHAARALVLGLALRLAHTVTGGATNLLQRTNLVLGDERLTLSLPEDSACLVGEVVERRLDALAKSLGRTGAIAYVPRPQAA
ncbi:Ppx/GppA family phosphatase [Arenibaculum pallidiluteum]|uniref:Ppx/GppA family phosphatase n=1 Tax=Arenibaculum pallidiluteum TaxID=2812559 RepID=UPI001A972973|nr:Ppx/GppA family phosphatase [Arenibaculum pallidiluteum]